LSFWYGLQFGEISEMPLASIDAYLNKLETRKTEVKLMMDEVIEHSQPGEGKARQPWAIETDGHWSTACQIV